jgi:hypothetical protein
MRRQTAEKKTARPPILFDEAELAKLDPYYVANGIAAAMGRKSPFTRTHIVWPDFKNAPHSSMYRDKPKMSAETKAKLRSVAPPARDNGDEVAKMLRECGDLDEAYACGAKFLKEKEKALRDKYKHLNPGQQRMIIGNRMRAKWKADHAKA